MCDCFLCNNVAYYSCAVVSCHHLFLIFLLFFFVVFFLVTFEGCASGLWPFLDNILYMEETILHIKNSLIITVVAFKISIAYWILFNAFFIICHHAMSKVKVFHFPTGCAFCLFSSDYYKFISVDLKYLIEI